MPAALQASRAPPGSISFLPETLMQLTLFYAPFTCSFVPYLALTEAGAQFEVQPVNTRAGQQMTPEYLKLNPKRKVPVLVIDGQPITETVAIQIWIARTFPQAKLLPADPMHEIRAISLMAWCASGIHPHITRLKAPARFCNVPGTEENVRRLAAEQLFENFQIADDMLKGREFFFDHFTVVDAHFVWCFRAGMRFNLDQSRFANCMAHLEHMKRRPSVQKLLAYEKEVQAEFAKAA